MSDRFTLQVLSVNATLASVMLEASDNPPWKLVVTGVGFDNREFQGSDLFDALIGLRNELEKVGARLLCAGARIDVFPSGMSRSMGPARKAYITRLGAPATEIIDIFDRAEPNLVGSVDQQREFHDKWMHSLTE